MLHNSLRPCLWISLLALLAVAAAGQTAKPVAQITPAPQPAVTSAPQPGPDPAAAQNPADDIEIQNDPSVHMVAVEALVVEVNEERTRDLGLTYGFNQATAGLNNTITEGSGIIRGVDTRLGRQLGTVSVPVLINGPQGATAIGSTRRLPGLGVSLVGMNVDGGAISARLRALLNTGDATIRTRPIAIALNKTKVCIETVSEVPTLLVAGRQLSVEFRKVGVLMEVTPTIESLRPIGIATLNISRLEVSSVSNFITTRAVDRPVFTRSATQTKVTLGTGETFVVGGLKTRRMVHVEDRVPILGDIWLIGLMFRSQQDIERNLDVLFFITPYILPPGQNFLLPFDFKNQQALGLDVSRSEK